MIQWPNVFVVESDVAPVVSVDWLAFSCVLPREWSSVPLELPSGWSAAEASSTAVWTYRLLVYDGDGNKACTILAEPRSGIIDSRRAVLQVANRFLYYDDCEDFCHKCLNIKHLAVTGLNRIDLCGDFEMTAERWGTYWRLGDGSAYLKALRMGRKDWRMLDGIRYHNQLSWGSPQSVLKWKVYWKWLEIMEAAEDERKEYILELWREHGMRERYVWRCEVSITDVGRLVGADDMLPIGAFDWVRRKVELWSRFVGTKFVVRANEGHADKRYDAILPFLEGKAEKAVAHALAAGSRDDSSAERRVALKLWSELCNDDVKADRYLYDSLAGVLMGMLERPSVVNAVCRAAKMSIVDVEHAICDTK